MYWLNLFCLTGVLALLSCSSASPEPTGPGLGQPISQSDLAPWDISIETNGDGLPPGSGTVSEGESVYVAQCQACHNEEGAGQPHDRLVGGHGTLDQLQQVRTVGSFWPYASTVYDYIRRAMPFATPQTLTDDEVSAVTAYLLYLNGIIDESTVLDAQSLAAIRMPNEDGFILSYP